MAKLQTTGLTPGDANPKKKANQKRGQSAAGGSTGDVSQVDLQFQAPKIQQFKWYGESYSKPTEPNLVPTLDLPSVDNFYDETRVAKQNEFQAFIDNMGSLKREIEELPDQYTNFRVKEQKALTGQATQILDTFQLTNDGKELNPAKRLKSIENQLEKIVEKKDNKSGTWSDADELEVINAERTLLEIRKNKRLQNTLYSIEEERKVYDNLSSWDSVKFDKAYSVDKLDKNGNQVFKINNKGQVETEVVDGVTKPVVEQVLLSELDPSDPRYKAAYNKHVYGGTNLGIFEHNNVEGYVTQHKLNDRTSQNKAYDTILNTQTSAQVIKSIDSLGTSIKNDETFTDAKTSEQVGLIVERINDSNLSLEQKKQLYKDLFMSVGKGYDLDGLSLIDKMEEIFYGVDGEFQGIGFGPSNSRYSEIKNNKGDVTGYKLNTFFIDTLGGKRFIRDMVVDIIRERDDFNKADKTVRSINNQGDLMAGTDEVFIDGDEDQNAKAILLNYNNNGTENTIRADSNVISAKKVILSKIEENYQNKEKELNNKLDAGKITQFEFNQRIEELQSDRDTVLKNLVYDLTPLEFGQDLKLLKGDANKCILSSDKSSSQCNQYYRNFRVMETIYGKTPMALNKDTSKLSEKIDQMEGSLIAAQVNSSLSQLEKEFKDAYKAHTPSADAATINAAWEQIRGATENYLIDNYFDLSSDGSKVTQNKLLDQYRNDKENGNFKKYIEGQGVDPLSTGQSATLEWYGENDPGTSYVEQSKGGYGDIINRLDPVNFDADNLNVAGTSEYSFALHLDSPNGVMFNPDAGVKFYFNVLFTGRNGTTQGGVFISPLEEINNNIKTAEALKGKEFKLRQRGMQNKISSAYKNLENAFEIVKVTDKYGGDGGDGVNFGSFIIFETENSVKNLYPEAVTENNTIDWSHKSIPENLRDFPQQKEFLMTLNGVETFNEVQDKINLYQTTKTF